MDNININISPNVISINRNTDHIDIDYIADMFKIPKAKSKITWHDKIRQWNIKNHKLIV